MKDIDSYMGDEPEIESEIRARREAYENYHADDWKYQDDFREIDAKTR